MQIHHYHELTGVYLGKSTAEPDPMEPGRWLVPAHATDKAPSADLTEPVWTGAEWVEQVKRVAEAVPAQ